MDNTDYLGRVEKLVRENLLGQPRIIALVEDEIAERHDYWERIYTVAWSRGDGDRDHGTHRACIDSEDRSMLVIGHYDMTREDAIADMVRRSGRELVR